MSRFILQVLQGTPSWVWAVLALVTWRGIDRMRTRDRALARLTILPTLFLLWGLGALWQHAADATAVMTWLAMASVGAMSGWRAGARLEFHHGKVRQPGSMLPLLFLLAVFALKYGMGVWAAVDPAHALIAQRIGLAVSGACGGYFVSQWLRLWQRRVQGAAALA